MTVKENVAHALLVIVLETEVLVSNVSSHNVHSVSTEVLLGLFDSNLRVVVVKLLSKLCIINFDELLLEDCSV